MGDQMQRESQYNQLMNAANYQYFAQNVAEGGCGDKDGNCRYYTSYCDQANIKEKCQRTCGLCGGAGSGGASSGGGGSGTCSDQDGNCRYYTSYCNTENVKAKCKKTCGLCSSGSSGSGGSSGSSGGSDGCQWYK